MKNNKKILFIFPPIASPVSPYLSTPLLAGQLDRANFDVTCLDLSLEFFNYILNKNYLFNSLNKAKETLKEITQFVEGKTSEDVEFNQYSNNLKQAILHKEKIEKLLGNEQENISLIENISDYVNAYRKESFFNPVEMNKCYQKIVQAFKFITLPFGLVSLSFNSYSNLIYKSTFPGLKFQAEDNNNNIFYDFFINKIKEYEIEKYDLVYISCPNQVQILPAMTFSKALKSIKKTIPIAIGGNIISRIDKELASLPNFFEDFFDFAIIGSGEQSVVELADYILNKKGNLKSIKGLMYKAKNKIVLNKPDNKYNVNKSAMVTLKGINLKEYYTPDIIMPMQVSKGCYWGKCLFCGLHYPQKKYSSKTPKSVVDELEFLNSKHNIKYFEFIDEAIHPKYLSKLADEIIERKIDIKYVCCARIETKYYTKELCEKLYKSGLRLIEFGFESANCNIYNQINKGIKFENRIKCIEQCANAGIFTYLYAIIGFPKETKEEALNTIEIIDKYPNIIDFIFIHKFWLDKKAPACKQYKKVGIQKIIENKKNIFNQSLNFSVNNENYRKEFDEIYNFYTNKTKLFQYNFLAPDEYIFLYVLHYGKEKAKELLNSFEYNLNE